MNLQKYYPKLFKKLKDKNLELRHLLNVDENYEDYDSEEFEFEPDEYNFIIYIADPIKLVLGEERFKIFVEHLGNLEAFENFVLSEEDLYGIKSTLNDEEIAALILEKVEALL
ncbi:MAG: hypothetical protein LGB53_05455 [Sulfurovum sp.]|nr:hypothetical protein [Sulfurovum sp.]